MIVQLLLASSLTLNIGTCLERSTMSSRAFSEYGLISAGAGLNKAGNVLEVFVNPDNANWMTVITFSDGTSCINGAGRAWIDTKIVKPGI